MIKILVADKLAESGVGYLRQMAGVDVEVKTGLTEEALAEIVGEYDGLLVRSAVQVTANVLANPGRLKAIARAGVGVDNIDLSAATEAGVLVMNSADASTITTAEHAFALLMAMARNIGPAHKVMTEGGWGRSGFVGRELSGKTLGVVGFGRIGQHVARLALGCGMKVLAFDPVFNADIAMEGKVRLVRDFGELVEQIDFVTFHVPLNDHTRSMLNAEMWAKAKPGLMVVNAARGGVVDIPDLIEALDQDKCGGAAIDVFETEPLEETAALRKHPKILLTPHLGASTAEAQEGVSTSACEQLLEYLQGEGLRGAVNVAGVSFDLSEHQMRFVDLARRMAMLVAPMCDEGIRCVTVTCQGETLPSAASTIERVVLVELLQRYMTDPVNVVNATVLGQARGISSQVLVDQQPRVSARVIVEVQTANDQRVSIEGCVYADGRPRVLRIGDYRMDIVPSGRMVLMSNEDRPGMVGLVGQTLGDAGVNIANMALSRSSTSDRAMMLLTLDGKPCESLGDILSKAPGILKVALVDLPVVEAADTE